VKELNGLPLALEQAAVLLRKNVVTVSSFLSDYKSQYRTLMSQYPPRGYLPYEKNRPITAVFSMLYRFVRAERPEAAVLLTFIALLGSWQIPISFIESCHFDKAQDHSQMDDDTNTLRKILDDGISLRLALDYLSDVCLVKKKYDPDHLTWRSFSVHRAISHWCVEVIMVGKDSWILQAACKLAIGISTPSQGCVWFPTSP
jgi:hypothetical protein